MQKHVAVSEFVVRVAFPGTASQYLRSWDKDTNQMNLATGRLAQRFESLSQASAIASEIESKLEGSAARAIGVCKHQVGFFEKTGTGFVIKYPSVVPSLHPFGGNVEGTVVSHAVIPALPSNVKRVFRLDKIFVPLAHKGFGCEQHILQDTMQQIVKQYPNPPEAKTLLMLTERALTGELETSLSELGFERNIGGAPSDLYFIIL